MTTCFMIPGKPIGKARPRVNTYTHRAYTPPATKNYEATVRSSYMNAAPPGERLHTGPVRVQIMAYYPIPKSWNKARKRAAMAGETRPEVKPDLDNCAKAILDALNGLAYEDDASITDLTIHKRYAEIGHVIVRIESGEGVAECRTD